MSNHFPIPSPPPELVDKWVNQSPYINPEGYIATQAAQWGSDQELQACINFVYDKGLCDPDFHNKLRTARRPKPPSLKEQALEQLKHVEVMANYGPAFKGVDLIRRALLAQPVAVSERLPGPKDCDAEDNCWWFDPHADGAWYVDTFQSCYTHWLPANALPTPEAKP